MFYLDNLFENLNVRLKKDSNSNPINVSCKNDAIFFSAQNVSVDGLDIYFMYEIVARLEYDNYIFNFIGITLADGLVTHFLDLMVYYLIKNGKKVKWNLVFKTYTDEITELDSYLGSAINLFQKKYDLKYYFGKINYLMNKQNKLIDEDFINIYKKEVQKCGNTTRIFLSREALNNYKKLVSDALIETFNDNNIFEEVSIDVNEVINEIIENIKEKTNGEIIIIFNINDVIISETNYPLKMLECSILSLQETTIYDDVGKFYGRLNVESIENIDLSEQYQLLKKIHNLQLKYLNSDYTIEHLDTISAFHHRVSSRDRAFGIQGGTGLPSLIKRVNTHKSDTGFSYVYTGNVVIRFIRDNLDDRYGVIAFNNNTDITSPPDKSVLDKGNYLPGVAYNLVFALERKR